ncbi:Alanyl-tRNA editing protein Aarsd1 [Sciurus carolinensis]|uniref:Alanyl-tRNA editing protein Aarsd1 n=1 Tax=Sciurus carolinensis TaxID=30640 RepID=A0AA41N1L2_SCICA|nr:Alanyl-tRNA editing protein Aarsd1 [Sciurus carolinensis]
MAFLCQRDSYTWEFTTTEVSCQQVELQTDENNGKKEVLSGFHVMLEDTLLFPEGGGQSEDHEDHVEAVIKLQNSSKLLQKNNLNLLRDLVVHIAHGLRNSPDWGGAFVLHRKEGDSEFMNIIANGIGFKETFLFLTVGDEKGAGLFLLAGPAETVETLEPRYCYMDSNTAWTLLCERESMVAEVLEGKGAGKKGHFQGEVAKMSCQAEVQVLLQNYVSKQSTEG